MVFVWCRMFVIYVNSTRSFQNLHSFSRSLSGFRPCINCYCYCWWMNLQFSFSFRAHLPQFVFFHSLRTRKIHTKRKHVSSRGEACAFYCNATIMMPCFLTLLFLAPLMLCRLHSCLMILTTESVLANLKSRIRIFFSEKGRTGWKLLIKRQKQLFSWIALELLLVLFWSFIVSFYRVFYFWSSYVFLVNILDSISA